MTADFTSKPLVHTIAGAADAVVSHHTYGNGLPFDLYRPPHATGPLPVVVFVTGLPGPGVVAMLGTPLKDWASYVGWGRMVAASGIAAVLYDNREPADIFALLAELRAHAGELGLDAARLGVWACSGNAPLALAVIAREPIACAALLYGYLLDLDGATAVADAAAKFHFAVPRVALADLPTTMPLLVVRAGRDEMPGLDPTLQRFVAAARARGMPLQLIDHPDARHAFDLVDDTPATHAVIEQVLAFLRELLVS